MYLLSTQLHPDESTKQAEVHLRRYDGQLRKSAPATIEEQKIPMA
jgi:hypothetical protein